jgi:sugar phosphate permease
MTDFNEGQQSNNHLSLFWPWVICSLGALYYCYEYFLRIVPSVITPELMRHYHLTGAEVGNLSAFYYHAYMPMQIVVGILIDRYGPKRLLTLACLLCVVGTYLFTGSQSLTLAAAGRFLVGFGSAFAFVGALKLATIWFPANRFALVSGIIVSLGMMGAMAGDVVRRALIDAIGWVQTLYISAFIGLVLALMLWVFIRDENPNIPLHHIKTESFQELLTGLGRALKNPQIWLSGMIGFLLYLSLSAFAEMWGITYLEQAHGLAKNYAATANAMVFLGWAIGSPLWGWISDHICQRRLPIIIGSIAALIIVCLIIYVPGWSLPATYLLLFAFGFFTSAEVLVFAISKEVSPVHIAGIAIALTNMIVMIGGNIFQPLIGKLLDLKWDGLLLDGARIYPLSAYQFAMSILPISIAVALILTMFMRETCGNMHLNGNHDDSSKG